MFFIGCVQQLLGLTGKMLNRCIFRLLIVGLRYPLIMGEDLNIKSRLGVFQSFVVDGNAFFLAAEGTIHRIVVHQ